MAVRQQGGTQAPVRRTVVGRDPVRREPFAPSSRRRWRLPSWLLRAIAWQLVLFALLALLGEYEKPHSLPESVLVGPRLATGPICIDEAVDISGSMTGYLAQRADAERALVGLARRQLEPSDSMEVAFFTGRAALALPPTSLEGVTAPPAPSPGIVDTDGTALAPAIEVLGQARAGGSGPACAARALVVITDGEISDPAETAAALTKAGYTRVFAVVPADSGWGRPGPLREGLDSVTVYHFTDGGVGGFVASVLSDSRPLDVVFGDVVGSLTGQELHQIQRTP